MQRLGRCELPRLTDCFNDGKGISVGDANMELGQLRSYVRALSLSSIQEIFELGSSLADISTVCISLNRKAAGCELSVFREFADFGRLCVNIKHSAKIHISVGYVIDDCTRCSRCSNSNYSSSAFSQPICFRSVYRYVVKSNASCIRHPTCQNTS